MPVDADKWHGIFNATEDLPMCMQRDLFGNILGQEDCLYLNVYTPKVTETVHFIFHFTKNITIILI